MHELCRMRFDLSTPEGRKQAETWKLLMDRLSALGMDLDVVATGLASETPLHIAVKSKSTTACEWLINKGASVNLRNVYVAMQP